MAVNWQGEAPLRLASPAYLPHIHAELPMRYFYRLLGREPRDSVDPATSVLIFLNAMTASPLLDRGLELVAVDEPVLELAVK